MASDFSLFPNKEEWGSGDEAMDMKLSVALKNVTSNLSLETIGEFYSLGLSLKPRAYNPAFHTTIELVTKALFANLYPDVEIDQLMKKMKGNYALKKSVPFVLNDVKTIVDELKKNKTYRYKGQIDFSLHRQIPEEKNPFVRYSLKRSQVDFHVKILMKDFRAYLNGEKGSSSFEESLFQELRHGEKILVVNGFGELWYDRDQIYSIPAAELNNIWN